MPGSEFAFRAGDGAQLLGRRWLPEGRPRAFVQIAHGLAEHSARYARFAGALNAAGYGVYASDHRGHGPSVAARRPRAFRRLRRLGEMRRRSLDLQPADRGRAAGRRQLSCSAIRWARSSPNPSSAQHSEALAGILYSGSNGSPPAIATLGRLIARAERLRLGKRGKSRLLNQMMFGDFNRPFKPARTDVDWLSRDTNEVDAYVADPLCGFPFTTQLAIDLLDALPGLLAPERLARIRKHLPIYVFSGERDPVGPNIKGLIETLKAAGFTRLTTRIYPDARHETLNETNRDEVTRDLIAWLDRVVG